MRTYKRIQIFLLGVFYVVWSISYSFLLKKNYVEMFVCSVVLFGYFSVLALFLEKEISIISTQYEKYDSDRSNNSGNIINKDNTENTDGIDIVIDNNNTSNNTNNSNPTPNSSNVNKESSKSKSKSSSFKVSILLLVFMNSDMFLFLFEQLRLDIYNKQ